MSVLSRSGQLHYLRPPPVTTLFNRHHRRDRRTPSGCSPASLGGPPSHLGASRIPSRAEAHSTGAISKEVCDLLVAFGDDVLIFSDKDCVFAESGELHVRWARWYRRAIDESASQLHGAERVLRSSAQLFLDAQVSRSRSRCPSRRPNACGSTASWWRTAPPHIAAVSSMAAAPS
jgi:hypothetical protein